MSCGCISAATWSVKHGDGDRRHRARFAGRAACADHRRGQYRAPDPRGRGHAGSSPTGSLPAADRGCRAAQRPRARGPTLIAYFDTSAFVKLVLPEHGSGEPLAAWREDGCSSVPVSPCPEARARVGRGAPVGRLRTRVRRARSLLARLATRSTGPRSVATSSGVRRRACGAEGLRAYDAVHLGLRLSARLASDVLITADRELAVAARRLGYRGASRSPRRRGGPLPLRTVLALGGVGAARPSTAAPARGAGARRREPLEPPEWRACASKSSRASVSSGSASSSAPLSAEPAAVVAEDAARAYVASPSRAPPPARSGRTRARDRVPAVRRRARARCELPVERRATRRAAGDVLEAATSGSAASASRGRRSADRVLGPTTPTRPRRIRGAGRGAWLQQSNASPGVARLVRRGARAQIPPRRYVRVRSSPTWRTARSACGPAASRLDELRPRRARSSRGRNGVGADHACGHLVRPARTPRPTARLSAPSREVPGERRTQIAIAASSGEPRCPGRSPQRSVARRPPNR